MNEVAHAAAAHNLGEDANITAAQNLGEDANVAAAYNLGDDANAAATKGDRRQLRELSKRIKKCIRDEQRTKNKKKYNGFWRNSEASKIYHA